MLVKKLKRIGKECRKADDPVLLTVAAYVDHVVNYLGRAKDDDVQTQQYGSALARLDLSAVVKAHEALAVSEPIAEQEAGTPAVESSGVKEKKTAKKAKKKEAKKEMKAQATQAVADSPAPPEAVELAKPPVENSNGEGGKKGKKSKKKAK